MQICLQSSPLLRYGWDSFQPSHVHCSSLGVSWFPTFPLPVGVQLIARFYSLLCGMRSLSPYHLNRCVLNTSTTDCWPVLRFSSISLISSCHLTFIIFLKHLLPNLLPLFSMAFSPFYDLRPYFRREIRMILNSLSFAERDMLCASHILLSILNAALAFPILMST